MAFLEGLPASFLLHILKLVPDFKALDALTRASPVYRYVFVRYAVEVFEHVMLHSVLDRIAWEIRAFISILCRELCQDDTALDCETLYEQAKEPLATSIPASVICHALRKFSYLASLGDAILYKKLEHLQSLPHRHLLDRTLSYTNGTAQADPGEPFEIPNPLSPLQFVEQQRALRAVWRLLVNKKLFPSLTFPRPWVGGRQWLECEDDDVDEMASSIDSLAASSLSTTSSDGPLSWTAMVPPPPSKYEASRAIRRWRETLEDAECSIENMGDDGWKWFRICLISQPSPLAGADWGVMRSLGMGFWSTRRMTEELQLLGSTDNFTRPWAKPLDVGKPGDWTKDEMLFTIDALYRAELASRLP